MGVCYFVVKFDFHPTNLYLHLRVAWHSYPLSLFNETDFSQHSLWKWIFLLHLHCFNFVWWIILTMPIVTKDGKIVDYRSSLPDNLLPTQCNLGDGYPKGRKAGRDTRMVWLTYNRGWWVIGDCSPFFLYQVCIYLLKNANFLHHFYLLVKISYYLCRKIMSHF